jgi:hypothetical protein
MSAAHDTVASTLASLAVAIENCKRTGNAEWLQRHTEKRERILATAPSGSGLDSGVKLVGVRVHDGDCVSFTFQADFHHMNDNGYYDGWTEHTVRVTPAFSGISLRVTGRDRNDIKSYIHETMHAWLTAPITIHSDGGMYIPGYLQGAASLATGGA